MRKTKRLIPQFTFYDRTGIEALLEQQAEKGWLLEKISSFGWKLKRIEPRKIHYAVNYFPKASAFDPEPSEEQLLFQEFCAHTGWKLAGATAQMQIFYNEAENPVPIETDPLIELENIEKSMKKTVLPNSYILLGLGVLQLVLQFAILFENPLRYLGSNMSLIGMLMWGMLVALELMETLGYHIWRKKARIAAEEGLGFVPTPGFRSVQLVAFYVIMVLFLWILVSAKPELARYMLIYFFLLICVVILSRGLTGLLKKCGVSAERNKKISTVTAGVLGGAVAVFMLWGGFDMVFSPLPEDLHEEPLSQPEMPLRLEDLISLPEEKLEYFYERESSVILESYAYMQRIDTDAEEDSRLYYNIYDVKVPMFFALCRYGALHLSDGAYGALGGQVNYRPCNAEDWCADRAYQEFHGDIANPTDFVLCYGDRIVLIQFDQGYTPEQKQIVAEKLGK